MGSQSISRLKRIQKESEAAAAAAHADECATEIDNGTAPADTSGLIGDFSRILSPAQTIAKMEAAREDARKQGWLEVGDGLSSYKQTPSLIPSFTSLGNRCN